MFSVSFSTFTFILTSSFASMPISGTHAVIGSLIGAGLSLPAPTTVNWTSLIKIVIQWFASPTFSGILGGILMMMIASATMNTKQMAYRSRILWL